MTLLKDSVCVLSVSFVYSAGVAKFMMVSFTDHFFIFCRLNLRRKKAHMTNTKAHSTNKKTTRLTYRTQRNATEPSITISKIRFRRRRK